MNLRVYRPEVFQGNLKKKNYFEGWYYKHVSKDLSKVWSFIPGVSLSTKDQHSFIQVIDGISGQSEYVNYPLADFKWNNKKLYLKIGDSEFTEKWINLKIENENIKVAGRIDFHNITKYPKNLFSPGIMGWYSFIPFMECKHGVVSVIHDLSGSISLKKDMIDFNGGKGYIEKDWGSSFPESWLWIQANNFNDNSTSFNFSVAKIPWLGRFFIGFICFLYFNKKFYLFSTYNNSLITQMKHDSESVDLTMKSREMVLKVRVLKSLFSELRAPVSGDMSRRIKESIDSEVILSLYDKNLNLIYNDWSKRAGLEVIDKIFDYIKS